ncbi:CpaF family protein [Candidatus Micrarchaeota archaeon]|nr:CpaF family protein [Candidatus Micrarchaeota archaeon]
MLGWKILKNGQYVLDLPVLSNEEQSLISKIEDKFKDEIKNQADKKDLLTGLISEYLDRNNIYVDKGQLEYLNKAAYLHICNFGFLTPLLKDDEIEEISIIGPNKNTYVYLRNKGWRSVNACFTGHDAIFNIINKLVKSMGKRITLQNPRIDAILENGSRLHASINPISDGEITIRKFREKPFSPSEIYKNGTIDLDSIVLLSFVMQGDYSVLICGNTASGKTTTLNSLFSFVPLNERVLITEETPEINIPHTHQLRLISNREMGISLSNLVYDSLRMRPDRTIVGEVRNKEEVDALFDVLLGGQARGSYATFHAKSSKDAHQRLKSFGVSENDLESIDVLIVQKRMLKYDKKRRKNYELRRITEITDSGGKNLASSAFRLQIASDLGFSNKEFNEEFNRRKKLLSGQSSDFFSCFAAIQKNLYGLAYD